MARQTGIYIRATIDGVIFYEMYDKGFIRSMPRPFKRTADAEARSITLATSSKTGKALRDALLPSIVKTPTKDMEWRLVGALQSWLNPWIGATITSINSIPALRRFNFNPATSLRDRWQVLLSVKVAKPDLLQLAIPAFIPGQQLKTPAYTKQVVITISAASCNLVTNIAIDSITIEIVMPYNGTTVAAQKIPLPLNMPEGSLVAVAMKVTCMVTKKGNLEPSANADFMPSGIIAAMYL